MTRLEMHKKLTALRDLAMRHENLANAICKFRGCNCNLPFLRWQSTGAAGADEIVELSAADVAEIADAMADYLIAVPEIAA